MNVTVTTEGTTVDLLCWQVLGTDTAAPAVLAANPGLAALGPFLPIGTVVELPDLRPEPARIRQPVRLWG